MIVLEIELLHGRPTHREVQLAADEQHPVADGFGVEPRAVHAPEIAIVGIGPKGGVGVLEWWSIAGWCCSRICITPRLRSITPLAVRCARHQQSMQLLQRFAVV